MAKILISAFVFTTIWKLSCGIGLNCSFFLSSYYEVAGDIYICGASLLTDDENRQNITVVLGDHRNNKSHADVLGLEILNRGMEYFPTNIEHFFPNIKVLNFPHNFISDVSNQHLIPFPNLLYLSLYNNTVTSLDSYLFSGLQRIKLIAIEANNIKNVGHDFILPNNGKIYFKNNPCIDQYANTPDGIKALRFSLLLKCPPTISQIEDTLERRLNWLTNINLQVQNLNNRTYNMEQSHFELNGEVKSLTNKVNDLINKVGDLQHSNMKLAHEVTKLQEGNLELNDEVTDLQQSNMKLGDEVTDLQQSYLQLSNVVADWQQSHLRLTNEVADLQQSNLQLKNDVTRLQLSNLRLAKDVTDLQESNSEFTNEVTRLQQSNMKLADEVLGLEQSNLKLTDAVTDIQQRNLQLTNVVTELQQSNLQLTTNVTDLQQSNLQLTDEVADLKLKNSQLTTRIGFVDARAGYLEIRVALLEFIIESKLGFKLDEANNEH